MECNFTCFLVQIIFNSTEILSTAANHIQAELMCAMPVQAEWKRKEILWVWERETKMQRERERERENDVENEKGKNGVLPYVASLFILHLIPRNTSTAANQIRGHLQHAVKHEKSEQIWCVCVCECGKRERDTNHIQSAFCLVDRSMIVCVCVCMWNRDREKDNKMQRERRRCFLVQITFNSSKYFHRCEPNPRPFATFLWSMRNPSRFDVCVCVCVCVVLIMLQICAIWTTNLLCATTKGIIPFPESNI